MQFYFEKTPHVCIGVCGSLLCLGNLWKLVGHMIEALPVGRLATERPDWSIFSFIAERISSGEPCATVTNPSLIGRFSCRYAQFSSPSCSACREGKISRERFVSAGVMAVTDENLSRLVIELTKPFRGYKEKRIFKGS
ncbi:hypothetical protein E2C01_021390 [Portunus trituberculatus]|uniref:Uncharacterized protein n=1 Tax=Portunus trituberculatus TaxID=210409 RepID=A0A5B7E2D8_PORTR|nr:hypothetical protein [Portunus trituberculatus]